MDFLHVDYSALLSHTGSALALLVAFLVLFAESSLIFFLPGDSFVIAVALLASQDILPIWPLLIVMFLGAVLGNNLGYYLGKRFGHRLFSKENSLLFDKKHVERSELFYAKHGPITIILARFTPMVRTLAPVLAGVGKMEYKKFLVYNIVGAILWVFGLGLLSYYAGGLIPNVDRYILPFIVGVVILSFLPGAISVLRARAKRRTA